MPKSKKMDYFVGLDMGDASVGWAVTNLQYEILKINGKALWGIRLFDSAKTAAETRVYRSSRRRIDRTSWRIQMLQELFAQEIAKIDKGFFMRLKDSRLHLEDKSEKEVYNLFIDSGYTDKDFYNEYPTMYHLRYALATKSGSFDIRLLYLAIQHIAKHRGHFLFENVDAANVGEFSSIFNEVECYIHDELGLEDWTCQSTDQLAQILSNENLNISHKQKEMQKLLPASNAQEKAIVKAFSGGSVKLADLFDDEALSECDKNSISFKDDNFDEIEDVLEAALCERYDGLLLLKSVYDWSLLAKILRLNSAKAGNKKQHLISECKIMVYNEHKNDLKVLKPMLKGQPVYNKLFKENGSDSYGYYAHGTKGISQSEFCKSLKKLLESNESYKTIMKNISSIEQAKSEEEKLLFRIANELAFPKQITKDNGIIPWQVHFAELQSILNNAEGYLPFLKEKDADGLTVREKIEQIVKFRIPYYVGPLAGTRLSREKGRFWVKRTNQKIYPWNFDNVVDLEASAENFINKMTAKCTYLIGEDVLPKESLLYSEFMVRNALNTLTVNGERLSAELLQKIFEELFINKSSKVTKKSLARFFKQENIICDAIGGIDDKINASMKSYNDFKRIFGREYIEKHREQIENIIRWVTLFFDEKSMLEKKIRNSYPDISLEALKAIKKLKYKDWGRLSAALLDSEKVDYVDTATGEHITIISALRNTNYNFMELLSQNCKYGFIDKIDKLNGDKKQDRSKLSYKDVEELYVSPSVKRSIWQTLTILEEIKKIMGCEPKRIFIEMARSKEESNRTESRLKGLQDLYKKCKEESVQFMPSKNEITDMKLYLDQKKEEDLRSDKLYLYYRQMGRCMYTGEKIELASLYDNNLYDIDHIYPRSKTKDDSLSNRVLVKKQVNAAKSDEYPLNGAIRSRMHSFWKMLYNKGFIEQKKYDRLIRTEPLTDEELAGFINRQLVETRQSTKAVADILKLYYNSEIVYVKAGNVSDFRQQFKYVKCRDVNDLHHAKDAYLNIVVGNCYHVKFTKNPLTFIKKNHNSRLYSLKPDVFYKKDIGNNNDVAWIAGENGSMAVVDKMMHKNNILFTRLAVEGKGALYNQTYVKAGNGQLPLKKNLSICKYGGYDSLSTAYFCLVRSVGKKNAAQLTIEAIPLVYAKQGEEIVKQYLENVLNLKKPQILIAKIKKYSLLKINGFPMHVSGSSNKGKTLLFYTGCQLVLDENDIVYLKHASKYYKDIALNENIINDKKSEIERVCLAEKRLKFYKKHFGIDKNANIYIYNLFISKLDNNLYSKRSASQVNLLKSKKSFSEIGSTLKKNKGEYFDELSISKQIYVLMEILKLFKCASNVADLSYIGGGKNVGKLTKSTDITSCDQCVLINQSPTGVFEQEVDLMKL